jgi:membrane-associated phospholipid phosphatase
VRSSLSGRAAVWLSAVLAALSVARGAHAQAAPDRYRKNAYYAAHGGAMAAMFGGSIALTLLPSGGRGPDPCWFPGDYGLRGRQSTGAARLSDALIAVTIATPVAAAVGKGIGPRFLNTGVVYAETLSANLLLNSLSKAVFRRPRPYTYRYLDDRHRDDDWYVSFYSGHSSTAFSTAVAGSYLFAESAPDDASRIVMWGAELTLASATAVLRTRAGKHYYSDIVVGALVGVGLGVGVPALHGARYRPKAAELVAAGGGVVVGTAAAALIPFRQDAPVASETPTDVTVMPSTFESGGVGLSASGTF